MSLAAVFIQIELVLQLIKVQSVDMVELLMTWAAWIVKFQKLTPLLEKCRLLYSQDHLEDCYLKMSYFDLSL